MTEKREMSRGSIRAFFVNADRVEINCGYDSIELSIRDISTLRDLCSEILEQILELKALEGEE